MLRKWSMICSLLVVLSILLSACAPAATPTPEPTKAQGPELSGEIRVKLDRYYRPIEDPETAAVVDTIVKAYMAAHPKVKVTLLPQAGTDAPVDMAAQIAAGTLADIVFDQFFNRNQVMDKWWAPLDKYFEMPNPYIAKGTPGSDRWMDSFDKAAMGQVRAPDGHYYQVALDWVETALFYNKAMFKKAGVDPNWKSWGEFVTAMKKVKDANPGVDPLGAYQAGNTWSNWYWADSVFLSAVWQDKNADFYLDKYTKLQPTLKWRQLVTEEISKAIIDGKLNATDPRMDTFLKISKDFVNMLPVDYIGISSLDDLQRMFLQQKLAVFWGGTWNNKQITTDAKFEWGLAYFPPFTATDFPGAPNVTYRVGGPSSAGQYGIPVSTVKAGRLDVVVDFLMYLSAPQNFGKIANTFGGFLPMVAGTDPGPVLSNLRGVAALPDRLFTDPSGRLTKEQGDDWSQIMQGFFLGKTDDKVTKDLLQKSWMKGAQEQCKQQKWDWCK